MSQAKSVYFVMDGKEKLNITQVAQKAGISREVARDYVKRVGVETLAGVFARKEALATGESTKHHKLHDTLRGSLTTRQIKNIHPHGKTVTVALLSGRICRRGAMCPSLWWEKLTQSEFRKRLVEEGLESEQRVSKATTHRLQPVFSFKGRTEHCFKDHQPCKNYRFCTDYREKHFKHHPIYNKAGCFEPEGIRLKNGDGTKICRDINPRVCHC